MPTSSDLAIEVEADAVEYETGVHPAALYVGHADFRGCGMRLHGVQLSPGNIDEFSAVVTAITELRDGEPHIGDAVMTVHNVAPYRDYLAFRVNVDWTSDLPYRVYFFVPKYKFIPTT